MSAYTPNDATLIRDRDQLREFMLGRVKERDQWVIGTEHEKIGFSRPRGGRPRFHGEIEEILLELERRGWTATRERSSDPTSSGLGPIISLHQDKASVTLEPGGQLELSGAPLRTLSACDQEARDHLNLLREISEPMGIIWSGLGTDSTPPASTPQMPKARYGVMRRYLPTQGSLALHMMHSTCTIQCNLDYSSEEDAMRKLRASLYLQPIVMAMFANSFALDHLLRSGNCARSTIWLNTDSKRYLYPAEWLKEGTPLMSYVDWALKVPMFFIARDGEYLDCAGLPFERFLKEGFEGHQATMGDFELHLSTLFPDARLKQHLEVRGADMSSPEYITALSAFHVGLLYDDQQLERCLDLFGDISADQLWSARAQVDEQGLKTELGGKPLSQWGVELIELSTEGVSRWEEGAERFLAPLFERVSQGLTPADENRRLWDLGYIQLLEGTRIS